MDARVQPYADKMRKAIDFLEADYASIRAGRANPHVLDKIRVDYYGTPTPIQQVGNVTVPEARIIQIAPWEKSLLREIEKAILTSDLGINPSNDGSVIRLIFPELTEERRKDLAKEVKKKAEDQKVAIRNIRRAEVGVNINYNNAQGLAVMKALVKYVNHPALVIQTDDSKLIAGFTPAADGTVEAAAGVSGTWNAKAVKDLLGENMGVAKLPTVEIDGQREER